ncbi:MAG: MFS transporter [Planctomycetes bacterium]|nr:MFS transporter [Planctomycetota bacterium]
MEARTTRNGAPWALALLTAIYAFNFADRQLLSIALEDVQRDIGASDAEMGLLTGTAFAIFYTFAGIPLARLADRWHRWRLLSLSLAAWSAFTSLSALARSFAHLALARIGVGVGEAACSPCAHSLLSDLFPPSRRASAIAIYSTGIYLGTLLAYEVGGWMCKEHGWKLTFLSFGAVGALLALVGFLALREPARERGDEQPAPRSANIASLLATPSFRHLALGAGIKSIAGYALLTWVPTFLSRVHGMDSETSGRWLGPVVGLGGALGTFGGGWLADRLGGGDARRRVATASWATLAATPFLYLFLFASDPDVALLCYAPAAILGAMYLGPVFTYAQDCARPEQRALASAVLLFGINLIGLGMGPWIVGVLNGVFEPSQGALAVRSSLAVVSLTYLWGAAHMAHAARAR